ncbi:hypothetical protein R83H12_02791 [Fibrobacteria bacterium R8-3-H12]
MVPVNKKGSCSKKTKLDVRSMGSLLGKNPAMVFAKSVLQKAGLKNFSLDLWIGERGFALSGGERQKLAAARVMLCTADLIIADEPGAHLPEEDEENLFDEITNLPNQPAALKFSHTRPHHRKNE